MQLIFESWNSFIKEEKPPAYLQAQSPLNSFFTSLDVGDKIILRFLKNVSEPGKKLPTWKKGKTYIGHLYSPSMINIEYEAQGREPAGGELNKTKI